MRPLHRSVCHFHQKHLMYSHSNHHRIEVPSRRHPNTIYSLRLSYQFGQELFRRCGLIPWHADFTNHHFLVVATYHIFHIGDTRRSHRLPSIRTRIKGHADHVILSIVLFQYIENPAIQIVIVSSLQMNNHFGILRDLGMNSIRLRVWVNPSDGWCNKNDVLAKAWRAHQLGMRLMIDFHYSDVGWIESGNDCSY